jgi:hypothetical protein
VNCLVSVASATQQTSPLLTENLVDCSFHPRPVIVDGFVKFSAAGPPRMDPEFSEDEFNRLLRDEAVPDAILRATNLLETEALGSGVSTECITVDVNIYCVSHSLK